MSGRVPPPLRDAASNAPVRAHTTPTPSLESPHALKKSRPRPIPAPIATFLICALCSVLCALTPERTNPRRPHELRRAHASPLGLSSSSIPGPIDDQAAPTASLPSRATGAASAPAHAPRNGATVPVAFNNGRPASSFFAPHHQPLTASSPASRHTRSSDPNESAPACWGPSSPGSLPRRRAPSAHR